MIIENLAKEETIVDQASPQQQPSISAAPGSKLSLAARFDDMCRFQSSISSNEKTLHTEFKKVLKLCDQFRSKWLTSLKDLQEAQKRIEVLETKSFRLERNLQHYQKKYEEKSENYRKTYQELVDLRLKIKEFIDSTKPETDYNYNQATQIENADLLARLTRLRSMSNPDEKITVQNSVFSAVPARCLGTLEEENLEILKNSDDSGREVNSSHSDLIEVNDSGGVRDCSSCQNSSDNSNLSDAYLFDDQEDQEDLKLCQDVSETSKKDFESEKTSLAETVIEYPILENQCQFETPRQSLLNHSIQQKKSDESSIYQTPIATSSDISTTNEYHQHLHQWQRKTAFHRMIYCTRCSNRIDFFSKYLACYECGSKVHNNCAQNCVPCFNQQYDPGLNCSTSRTLMDFVQTSSDCDRKPLVPQLLLKCCAEIEKRGLHVENLYQIHRPDRLVENLMLDFLYSNSSGNDEDQKQEKQKISRIEIHSLCNVVLYFLGYLIDQDDSLIPKFLWQDLVALTSHNKGIPNQNMIEKIVVQLPLCNRDTLAFLMIHLRKVFKNHHRNHVTMELLTQTFASKVIHHNECGNFSFDEMKKRNEMQVQIMKTLLSISSDFWIKILSQDSPQSSPVSSGGSDSLEGSVTVFQSPCGLKSTDTSRSVYGTPIEDDGDGTTKNCRMIKTTTHYHRFDYSKFLLAELN